MSLKFVYRRVVFKWPKKTIEDVVTIPGNPAYRAAMLEVVGYQNGPQDPEVQEQARVIGGMVDA